MIYRDLKGIIFDMDGTLTVPVINFALIRREIGIPDEPDIVDAIAAFDTDGRRRAWRIIHAHEERALCRASLQSGTRELIARCVAAGMRLGLLTRNTSFAAETICRRFNLPLSPILSREFPHLKPSAEPVLHICREWRLPPHKVLVVGDYLHDIISGRDAGAHTCFLHNRGTTSFGHLADITVHSAFELQQRLRLPCATK